jgi:hypothetical protein
MAGQRAPGKAIKSVDVFDTTFQFYILTLILAH